MTEEEIRELNYLRWFFANTDFGPAHEDVVYFMNKNYREETGYDVPDEYQEA